jgi:bifunctional oligoribonuclease and PAP phosphatase NrnA
MGMEPAKIQSLNEIRDILNGAQRVLIVSHIMPDGDTLGSALGMAWALRKRGIEARLSCADPVPADLRYLPGSDAFALRRKGDEQAIVVIDSSDLERIGTVYEAEAFRSVPVVNIDHHVTNLNFGTVNLVAPTASTAELILGLIDFLQIPLDAPMATCLLTGLVTDTQGFRTNNTTSESLRAAVTLMDAGAPLAQIIDLAFNHRSMAVLRVWGPVLANARFEAGILWAEVPQELLRSVGTNGAASKGLANFLSTFDQARVAAVFRELADGRVDISLRSVPEVDVSTVAFAFGGGGHPQAAGCLLTGSLAEVRERILAALREMLAGQNG